MDVYDHDAARDPNQTFDETGAPIVNNVLPDGWAPYPADYESVPYWYDVAAGSWFVIDEFNRFLNR